MRREALFHHRVWPKTHPKGAAKYTVVPCRIHVIPPDAFGPPCAEAARPAPDANQSKTLLHSDRGCLRGVGQAVHPLFRKAAPERSRQRGSRAVSERPCRARERLRIDAEPGEIRAAIFVPRGARAGPRLDAERHSSEDSSAASYRTYRARGPGAAAPALRNPPAPGSHAVRLG